MYYIILVTLPVKAGFIFARDAINPLGAHWRTAFIPKQEDGVHPRDYDKTRLIYRVLQIIMVQSEDEYEVESIQRAKVVKNRGKKAWSYFVKWKNFGQKDNTWEPVESFSGGSEHFIDNFWKRVDVGGRNVEDLTQFEENEEALPRGPPRGKPRDQKLKSKAKPPPPNKSDDSETEVKSLIGNEGPRGKKRVSSEIAPGVEASGTKRQRGRVLETQGNGDAKPGARERKVTGQKHSVPQSTLHSTLSGRATVATSSHKPGTSRRVASPSPTHGSKRQRTSRADSSPDEILLRPDQSRCDADPSPSIEAMTEEMVEASLQYPDTPPSPDGSLFDEKEARLVNKIPHEHIQGVESMKASASSFGPPTLLVSNATLPFAQPSIPAHRAREANPRVKLLDEPNLSTTFEGAVSVKARLLKGNSSGRNAVAGSSGNSISTSERRTARISAAKAGPGRSSTGLQTQRSSLLTAKKGILTTVKGKSRRAAPSDHDANGRGNVSETLDGPSSADKTGLDQDYSALNIGNPGVDHLGAGESLLPPTAEQLLKMAGLKAAEAQALPDFEEDAQGDLNPEIDQNMLVLDVPCHSGAAEEKQAAKEPTEVAQKDHGAAWKVSTIFGPLGIGRDLPLVSEKQDTASSMPERSKPPVFLSLDSAVSVPVVFKDAQPSGSFLGCLTNSSQGPPGKFYTEQYALALVDTLRSEGSFARLAIDTSGDETHKRHFERFRARLQGGELYIEMIGLGLLAMCSSDNKFLGEKLHIPATLLGLGGSILVAQVMIDNDSAYADAVIHADDVRWCS
ncbi:hypothetical protein AcV5_005988 [Taiwanofungus camphoratus]|nr:hypothetical protein AcV5_005988 [Antrodia cinnamomea]